MTDDTLLRWIGTCLQAGGALLVALNIPHSRYAFPFMLVGSLIWGAIAAVDHDWALLTQNLVFAGINVVGIYRWGRR